MLVCLYFSHHRDGVFYVSIWNTALESLSNFSELGDSDYMCPFPFNSIQENENGGYCSTENAIRERRAYGPELSHEDFTKFHEVSYQCSPQENPLPFLYHPL